MSVVAADLLRFTLETCLSGEWWRAIMEAYGSE